MNKLSFELVSPERLILSGEVDMVTVPGSEGEFGVLYGHAPLVALLRPGIISVERDLGTVAERIYVSGGFAEVSDRGLTILADEAIPVSELNRADIEARIRDASEDLADARTDEARLKAATALDQLKYLLSAAA